MQQVLLMDKSGEILADVNVGKKYNPLHHTVIKIIVAEVQEGELANKPIKKLYVDQWSYITVVGEPEGFCNPSAVELEVKSKIRCWLVAATIQSGNVDYQTGYVKYYRPQVFDVSF